MSSWEKTTGSPILEKGRIAGAGARNSTTSASLREVCGARPFHRNHGSRHVPVPQNHVGRLSVRISKGMHGGMVSCPLSLEVIYCMDSQLTGRGEDVQ
jgi:ABC-type nickel/cobalt efflux system permease component RcnA